jgi:hypothetical protein
MKKGKPQQVWLNEIDEDQNVQGLENIEATLKNETTRKWFLSQVLAGNVDFARYNPVTGRIELGAEDRAVISTVVSSVSAANTDIVIPIGQTWEITGMANRNTTTATGFRLTFADVAGGTQHGIPGNVYMPANVNYWGNMVIAPHFRLTGDGDRFVRVAIQGFVAADTLTVILYYRRVA